MDPNKVEIGQRVRAVQTGKVSYVPDCIGVIVAINPGGSARVDFDDGWTRIYFAPAEDLVAVDAKWEPESLKCENIMLKAFAEKLQEENRVLCELLQAERSKNEILSREARAALELANKAITSLEKVL